MGHLVPIFLVSAAAIVDEVFLIRLLSIRFWPHFVPLIVSQAMLGFGASGVAALLLRPRIAKAPRDVFAWIVLFSPFAFDLAFRLSQFIPFDPFLLVWEPSAWPAFCAFFALLSAPFALAGGAVAVPLSFGMGKPGPLYAASLGGASAGALLSLPLMSVVPTGSLLRVPVALCMASCAFVLKSSSGGIRPLRAILLAFSASLLVLPPAAPLLSPYKDLAVARSLPRAETIASRFGPSGVYTAVFAPGLHIAPGMSLSFSGELPRQAALFADGEMRGVVPSTSEGAPPAYLREFPQAFPYALVAAPSVLQFGLRGTEGVLFAAANGASSVTAVDPAAEHAELVEKVLVPYSGGWPPSLRVDIRTEGYRNFMARENRRFDIVELADISSGGLSSLGVHATGETFLLTREGIRAAIPLLRERGMLVVSGGLKSPPREIVKILRTVRDELRRSGMSPPSDRIIVVRGWGSFALAVRALPFSPGEVNRVRSFCGEKGFTLAWPPQGGGSAEEEDGGFRDAVGTAIAGNGNGSSVGLFDLRPAVDDSPYFHRFLRPSSLPEFRRILGSQWVPFVEWGVVFLLLSLGVSLLLAGLFLLLPPLLARGARDGGSLSHGVYFGSLGISYMLFELTYLKAGILLLGDPLHAATAAIGGFALFSGIGSALSPRFGSVRTMRGRIFPGIALLGIAGFLCMSAASQVLLAWKGGWRVATFLLCLAPSAFLMGMPFPAALSRIAAENGRSVPLAWGINGFFSVSGASLASVVSLWAGFRITVIFGGLLYLLAGFLFERLGENFLP
jgi:hypothetical protein